MTNKTIIYVPGRCPYCNSEEILYKKEAFDGYNLKIPMICKNCRKSSVEIYYTEYSETNGL